MKDYEPNIEVAAAFDRIAKEMRTDPEYRMAWQANIAMSVFDACRALGIEHAELHKACNNGADQFLQVIDRGGECETCGGLGEISQASGGRGSYERIIPCPDCKGKTDE